MNLLSILLLLLSFVPALADDCDKTKKAFAEEIERFRGKASAVSFEPLNNLVYEVEKCGYSFPEIGSSQNEIRKLRQRHFLAALDVLQEREKVSRNPDMTQTYLAFFERAKSLGIFDHKVEKKLNRNLAQAKQLRAESVQIRKENIFNSCQQKRDFSSELPPVRDQSINGWCYAYAAADLISQKLKQDISPIDLAFGYIEEGTKKDPSLKSKPYFERIGGHVDKAIRSREKIGYCSAKDMDFGEVNRFATLYTLNHLGEVAANDENALCENYQLISQLYKSLNFADFKKILETSLKDNLEEDIRNANCNKRVISSSSLDIVATEYGLSSLQEEELRPKVTEGILKSLTEGRIVGISLDILALLVPGQKRSDAQHAMVVIGNEMNLETGQCEFIVRNSWGELCSPFLEHVRCEKGIIRIPQEYLEKNPVTTTEIQ